MSRTYPYSDDIEKAIIGTILYNYNKIKKDIDLLHPKYFKGAPNKIIAKAIFKLHDNHKKVDATIIKDVLKNNNKLKQVGGVSFLTEFENQEYYTDNFEDYIKELKEYYERRQIIKNAEKAIDKAYSDEKVDDIKGELSQTLYSSYDSKSVTLEKGKISKFRKQTLIDKLNRKKIGTGYRELDRNLSSGFIERNTSVITGRPRMGKSTLKDNIILNQLNMGAKILVASTEMTAEEELDRLVSIKSGIPLYDLINAKMWMKEKNGKIKAKYPDKLELIKKTSQWLDTKDFYLNDGVASLSEIKSLIIRYKEMYDINIVYIDLVDRIKEIFFNTANKAQSIAKVVGELTQTAKQHNVHICLVAQQRRDTNRKTIPKPTISGIKGSGAYEEFTDLILGVHRLYVADENVMVDDEMEVFLLKQRQGKAKFSIDFDWEPEVLNITESEDLI